MYVAPTSLHLEHQERVPLLQFTGAQKAPKEGPAGKRVKGPNSRADRKGVETVDTVDGT